MHKTKSCVQCNQKQMQITRKGYSNACNLFTKKVSKELLASYISGQRNTAINSPEEGKEKHVRKGRCAELRGDAEPATGKIS